MRTGSLTFSDPDEKWIALIFAWLTERKLEPVWE
jgi:hypothetical protein